MRRLYLGFVLAALVLPGCASIVEGRSQEVAVTTSPQGATCDMKRGGVSIARIDSTPGSASIQKSNEDIAVECELKGYQKASRVNEADIAAWTFGNIVFGGLIGLIIDAATGSIHKYDSSVNVPLTPLTSDATDAMTIDAAIEDRGADGQSDALLF